MSRRIEIEYDDVLATTPKAVKLSIDGNEVWVPRSVIEGGGSDLDEGNFGGGTVEIDYWWLEREGFA